MIYFRSGYFAFVVVESVSLKLKEYLRYIIFVQLK